MLISKFSAYEFLSQNNDLNISDFVKKFTEIYLEYNVHEGKEKSLYLRISRIDDGIKNLKRSHINNKRSAAKYEKSLTEKLRVETKPKITECEVLQPGPSTSARRQDRG